MTKTLENISQQNSAHELIDEYYSGIITPFINFVAPCVAGGMQIMYNNPYTITASALSFILPQITAKIFNWESPSQFKKQIHTISLIVPSVAYTAGCILGKIIKQT